mmetsp:Transcript_41492/g.74793  ORF Transcript_41492/g.74793 Transcript_41492/m.74793 type:complete len:202 (+) Transcript_41492:848-1453(+)
MERSRTKRSLTNLNNNKIMHRTITMMVMMPCRWMKTIRKKSKAELSQKNVKVAPIAAPSRIAHRPLVVAPHQVTARPRRMTPPPMNLTKMPPYQCPYPNHSSCQNPNEGPWPKSKCSNKKWKRPINDAPKKRRRKPYNHELSLRSPYPHQERTMHPMTTTEMNSIQARREGSSSRYRTIPTPRKTLPTWSSPNATRGKCAN